MNKVSQMFGSKVFNSAVMKERLPKEAYKAVQNAIKNGKRLDASFADVVANSMKDWAIENGATHFTHWFQPMTGVTAEKHDSFISPTDDGHIIMEFKGKELVQGEPDASSFPSGGLRATFEARGYTAWDPTSFAFIKGNTLCIPTAFCTYGGEAMDKKTLFGAKPPKGQEMDDHYFGTIKSRVAAFMEELNEELWKLGILAKTEHNEVAPAQHELAPIFTTTNIATDHNQLTMELMQRIAKKHHMVCLLHEKPFAGVNGSGKHNNWSISTSDGTNLLEPGDTPHDNAQFLLFLCAVIKAVDDYQDLLRVSVASAGNDHRLGANEAPPAVVSIFLGDELNEILESIDNDAEYDNKEKVQMKIGVHVMPRFPKDSTDRNRTSPFAFTGNKFEFRMLGSSASVSGANIVLNTIVAESLRQFADELEGKEDFNEALHTLIKRVIREHKRIIFNGNGYDDTWIAEAKRRGLLNLKTTPDCLPYYISEKNQKLFATHKVLSETELRARYEIMLETYSKVLNIEALTMIDMVNKDIMPAISSFVKHLSESVIAKKTALASADCRYEEKLIGRLSTLLGMICDRSEALEQVLLKAADVSDSVLDLANYYKDQVLAAMNELRISVDAAEVITDRSYWPYPGYGDLLFGVR